MTQYDLAGNPMPDQNETPPAGRDQMTPGNAPQGYQPQPGQVRPAVPGQQPPGIGQSYYGQPPTSGSGQGNVWPPPISAPGYGQTDLNTSGQKAGVPPEIAAFKWNWGAFLLSWIWCFNHRLIPMGLILLFGGIAGAIPVAGFFISLALFGFSIYVALNGHKLAWENRRFDGGMSQYLDVQNAWLRWGIIINVVPTVAAVVIMVGYLIFSSLSHSP